MSSGSRSKKAAKPKNSPISTPSKKRKTGNQTADPVPSGQQSEIDTDTNDLEDSKQGTSCENQEKLATETPDKIPIFKDPTFVHSTKGNAGSKRSRVWKNLKQIVAAEKVLPWKPEDVTYGSIDAPPSFKPAKKYSDLSGLPALYTDPETKLRFATSEEYSRIRLMTGDLVNGCLALRKATTVVP